MERSKSSTARSWTDFGKTLEELKKWASTADLTKSGNPMFSEG